MFCSVLVFSSPLYACRRCLSTIRSSPAKQKTTVSSFDRRYTSREKTVMLLEMSLRIKREEANALLAPLTPMKMIRIVRVFCKTREKERRIAKKKKKRSCAPKRTKNNEFGGQETKNWKNPPTCLLSTPNNMLSSPGRLLKIWGWCGCCTDVHHD